MRKWSEAGSLRKTDALQQCVMGGGVAEWGMETEFGSLDGHGGRDEFLWLTE